jgi:dTDP-4-amino-4,6-dideoxygalactose transaminase
VSSERLAIYGGDRAVTAPFREHWRQVRLRDLVPLAWYVARGANTMPSGAGPVGGFERRFATRTGARYVLLMNSGTAALHSAFFAVGVKPGDEVIVPPYTFYASAGPVLHLGGVPVFCDIDEFTLTADPDDVESRITSRTRAICVVHVWGNPARLDRFVEIAKRHGVALIEDCSHAHGARYQGRSVGTWGDIGCYSLQGNKPVSGGEAGVAITENPVYFDRMLALAHNGRTSTQQAAGTFDIDDVSFGLKYRPHLAAAQWALNGLRRLDELNARRAHNYQVLVEAIGDTQAINRVETYPDSVRGGYFEFVFRYNPDYAGGWPVGAFALAAQAEGVPINVDRYTRQGRRAGLLHEAPVFSEVDFENLGGYLGGPTGGRPCGGSGPPLRAAEHLADRLLTLPPFTAVAEEFVRQCGVALRKVASAAADIADSRIGR